MTNQPPSQATPEQHQVWKEILERMTPVEREHVLDNVFRQGISVLVGSNQQMPNATSKNTMDDLSAEDMLIARMYASLTPEDKKSFLASFIEEGKNQADRSMSGKTKAS